VFCYVTATGLLTALSAFQVVGGIDCLASRANILSPDFLEPLPEAKRLDPIKIFPKLDPMRHRRLKLPQLIAGILFTFAAKVNAPLCRTGGHSAFFAERQPFSRPTPIALALFQRPISLSRKSFEPFRVFCSGDEP
jgi:hypothetical protein